MALDAQSLTKSSAAGWLSGARTRVGFAAPQGRELALWLNNCRVSTSHEHIVEKHLDLLAGFGAAPHEVQFNVPVDAKAEKTIDTWLAQHGPAGRFAIINTGAGWDSKLWPAERYAQVAAQLGRRYGTPSVVVWAGDRERGWAEEIVAAANGHATLAPDTKLPELAALLRKGTLFLGSDTGPLHLAAAVGTPCLGLYGPTRPQDCGPYGPRHRTLQAYLQEGTSRERRGSDNSAMRAIEVEQVLAACGEMLAARQAVAA